MWGGQGGWAPHFLLQMQFLTVFLDHRFTKSCKVDDQIAGNCISKIPVFKICQSAQTALDGSHLQLSNVGPHLKLRSVVTELPGGLIARGVMLWLLGNNLNSNPGWTSTQGLNIIEESVLPFHRHHEMLRPSFFLFEHPTDILTSPPRTFWF